MRRIIFRKLWVSLCAMLPLGIVEWCFGKMLWCLNTNFSGKWPHPPKKSANRGVNFVGYLEESNSLGISARSMLSSLKAVQREVCSIAVKSKGQTPDNVWRADFSHDVSIWYINGHIVPYMIYKFGAKNIAKKINIASWVWELDEFPYYWRPATGYFSEIWVPSQFNKLCFNRELKTFPPTYVIPPTVALEPYSKDWRIHFSLPVNKTLCLTIFSFDSSMARKNPQASIDAVRYANELCGFNKFHLVLKIRHSKNREVDTLRLRQMIEGMDVTVIDDDIPYDEILGLYLACDVVISLHRAEGFGLVPAEAMALGRPVIATNWSATTDFVNEENAWPVEYKLIANPQRNSYYRKGALWADADTRHAASCLVEIMTKPELARKKTSNAIATISEKYSFAATVSAVNTRLTEVRRDTYE